MSTQTPSARVGRPTRSRRLRLVALVTGPLAAIAVSGGTAVAYFSLTGTHEVPASSLPLLQPEVSTAGSLAGFYPGATREVTVTVTNPNPYRIGVDKIDAFSQKTASGCAAYALTSRPNAADIGKQVIGPEESRTYPLTVQLKDWAGNQCAGQTFTLTVRVFATSRT